MPWWRVRSSWPSARWWHLTRLGNVPFGPADAPVPLGRGYAKVNDADLRPSARAGGRLLLLHGTADELVGHRSAEEYFGRVRGVMRERAVDRFARFSLVPGANHANVETEFTAAWNSVGALEGWVERGVAPARPVVGDKGATGPRRRPLCAYPAWPEYAGTGAPDRAASFTCARGAGRRG